MNNDDATMWRLLAHHEAGHCVAAVLLGVEIDRVALREQHGETWTRESNAHDDATILMAGWAAVPFYSQVDHDVRATIALCGRGSVRPAGYRARALLKDHRALLKLVADELLVRRELTGAQVVEIVNGASAVARSEPV